MMATPLPPALDGERIQISSRVGGLSYYKAGSGPPLLLIHSVNAAASAAEVRPLHAHYSATRTVFSVDLPGFGFSERSDRAYTPALMTEALQDKINNRAREAGVVPRVLHGAAPRHVALPADRLGARPRPAHCRRLGDQ